MAITDFPASLQPALQQGFLARFFEEGLDSEMAYRHDAIQELIPVRAGNSITLTRVGRTPPQPTALNPANVTGLDNGLSPSTPSVEQYTYNVNQYAGLKQLDLLAEEAGIADQLKMFARTNGVEAALTVERVAKQTLFAAYNTGNTWVRGDLGAPSTTTMHVDDIRGFQMVPVNGVMTPVSSSNPLPVLEVAFGNSGVNQSLTVTAAVADAPTSSVYPSSVAGSASDGISGVLTIVSTGTAPISGDAIISSLASPVLRPNNKQGTNQLTAQDTLTIGLIQDAQALLSQNAIPKHRDGTYHALFDYHSMRELLADQQFQLMFASKGNNREYQNNAVFTLFGITFIPTTEAYLQASVTAAGMQPLSANTQIHRVIVTGAEVLLQGTFAGLETYAQRDAVGSVSEIYMVDNIAHIIRAPIDNMGRQISLVYLAVFGMVCPTDLTATPAIIPTATNAAFKRAVVIEHV